MKKLNWKLYTTDNFEEALAKNNCLYVIYNTEDNDRPYYIGKAKYFGAKQAEGYRRSARYNSGYTHLLTALLRANYKLYIASLGKGYYEKAESYEQELIHEWNPIREQRRKPNIRKRVQLVKPWV
jgi:hypothetical protein